MGFSKRVLAVSLSTLFLGAGLAAAWSLGPPASRTGASAVGGMNAEGTCRNCHSDYALNSGTTLSFVNAPMAYIAGQTYIFTVQLASSNTAGNSGRVWSFELTAVNMTDGSGAGTFANVSGQGTQIRTGSGSYASREYIEANTDRVSYSSPVTWQVQWTAPDPGVGPVGFFAAGVAGNGTGSNKGDWVATTSQTTQDVTAVEAATWGSVKALYR